MEMKDARGEMSTLREHQGIIVVRKEDGRRRLRMQHQPTGPANT